MENPGEKTQEPSSLQTAMGEFVARHGANSRLGNIGLDVLRAHGVNRDRRTAVLAHDDLRRRLVKELGYAKPEQWNGYVPPAIVNPSSGDPDYGDFCRSAYSGTHGETRFQFGQLGKRAIGAKPNDSRRRKVLLEISQEAWDRARQAITKEDPGD